MISSCFCLFQDFPGQVGLFSSIQYCIIVILMIFMVHPRKVYLLKQSEFSTNFTSKCEVR